MPVIVTSGEPAGIGPEIILKAARLPLNAVVIADLYLMKERAKRLNLAVECLPFQGNAFTPRPNCLQILHKPLVVPAIVGQLNVNNAPYVLSQIKEAARLCMTKQFSAMVTAPVSKSIINQADIAFSGHTEYLAELAGVDKVVMMLACKAMRVALVTTHLPLSLVPSQITKENIQKTIELVITSLKQGFAIKHPKIMVAGLNPHAGEGGYLGREEIEIIAPALSRFASDDVIGPVPADTMFSQENCSQIDAFIAMYHDQGLTTLKYAGFGEAVNITLGLPFVRTSVDHGTALSLAGQGVASEASLLYAIEQAEQLGANLCN